MVGQCALFDIEAELRLSHIIPKFAFDYMKSTGGKFLRGYEKPNQRVQDGPKIYLLSDKAELEFSKRERWFVNNIFLPYLKDEKKSFDYDEQFAYFTISLLWRVLVDQFNDPNIYNDSRFKFLSDVKNEWKLFLSQGIFPRTYNDLNIFLTDRVSNHTTNGINVDLYLSRIIDATIVSNDKGTKVAIYAKFLRFIFWGIVKGEPNNSVATKINFIKGTLVTPQKVKDDFFGNFLNNRIQEVDKMPQPSAKQQEAIISEVIKNENSFWDSDAGLAMINDFKFGGQASH